MSFLPVLSLLASVLNVHASCLGRRVATAARGAWPAGAQVVAWDGLTSSGAPVPAGMYVVRYSYPGGQDRQRIMRVR